MKETVEITLNWLNDIKRFVRLAENIEGGVTLKRGKFVVDGTSLLGIISLNPTEPCIVEYDKNEDTAEFDEFLISFSTENNLTF